jgi:beta-N-acetylhexosaminidase
MTRIITPPLLSRRAFLALAGGSLAAALAGRRAAVQAQVSAASLTMKIGQMLMVGFRGLEVDASHPIVQDIRERHLGGVVLFDYDTRQGRPMRNIESPPQLRALVETLHLFAPAPLLVGIDYEGGMVNRLKEEHGFPPTVSHQHLGRLDDLEVTYQHASQQAQTLADMGITLNLAPVVDLNVNPRNPVIGRHGRSFSADPQVVTRHALEYIRAHHEHGILCSLKHFPGHGSSTTDSHHGFTDVTETWTQAELEPFSRIIQAGMADSIMTAHVYNSSLDRRYPATLSHATITGLLRQQLGYDGVVFSDDLQMRAIADHYGFETAIEQAILAGVDILTIGNNAALFDDDIVARTVALIARLVQAGRISEARIDESYRRIVAFKHLLQLPARMAPTDVTARVDDPGIATVAYFSETGHTLRGVFRRYWEQHGGLLQFGYPLTEEFAEASTTVQYFERARFEHHPQNAGSSYAVLLSSLGTILTEHRQNEPPFRPAAPGSHMGIYFPETSHYLAPEFVDYWEQYGGVLIYGYPISESFVETNPLDGKGYLVQYFERARFEYHPRHTGTRYAVALGMLGAEMLRVRGWL